MCVEFAIYLKLLRLVACSLRFIQSVAIICLLLFVAVTGYDIIVDALFGFSFKPPVRESFVPVINMMKACKGHVPLVSIDVPSGMCLFMLQSPYGAFIHSFFFKISDLSRLHKFYIV